MPNAFTFVLESALLGVGLAMDAFSVSLANGLREPGMRLGRRLGMAGGYALFQFAMPVIGWLLVHTVAEHFAAVQHYIPLIGAALLFAIGGKMLLEGMRGDEPQEEVRLGSAALVLQGVATSIDALSVGFAIAAYSASMALACALIIAAVTYGICLLGIRLGRIFGLQLSSGASLMGGGILVFIGLRILLVALKSFT